MNLLNWLRDVFSDRRKALSLYRTGMRRAKNRDHAGAIDDYSAVIAMPNSPADVRAMALYNRALIHSAAGDRVKATDDLGEALAMAEIPVNVRTAARQKLVRMSHQTGEQGV